MPEHLVIGYGNTLRGDDAAGILAVQEIAERFPAIRSLTVHQLTPELAVDIADAEKVIFIDADAAAQQLTVRTVHPEDGGMSKSHSLSPSSLLALARDLYDHIPHHAYLIGIPATTFELSEQLSETAAAGVRETVELVSRMIME